MKTKSCFLPAHLASLAAVVVVSLAFQPAVSAAPPPPPPPPPPPKTPGAPPPPPAGAPNFGDPLPGLTAAQLANFTTGQTQFLTEDTVATGLGPIYNNVSCVACHAGPAPGGASAIVETRFGKMSNGVFDPLLSEGGSLLQQAAINPACQESIPADANVVAGRKTTPLFGLGLIDAIPDATIQANVNHPKVDGILGRAAMVTDVASGLTRVGRFGWKAQDATLITFSGDAYLNEIGVTNRLFPTENAPNGNTALLAEFETDPGIQDQPDPVTGKADIDRFTDFMQLLAPPTPLPLTPAAASGAAIFRQIHCAVCHVQTMMTGPSTIGALSFKPVQLWSDLLLHDMGLLGDGIAQSDAGTTEMRTSPLWGLRARSPYLHDGRAATIDAAIRLHDGEASTVRNRYEQLSANQRQALLDFLNTL